MQFVGILLILLNVGSIVAPVAGVAIVYQDHIQDIVIPPQLTDMINNTVSLGADPRTIATLVSADFDNVSRTATLTVDFLNPLNYTLNLQSLSAEVQCTDHLFALGTFSLANPVELPSSVSTPVVLTCNWTQNAETHFNTQHSGASTVSLSLVGLSANFNGVTIQLTESITIPDVPVI
jgi:hypothetical protein